MLAATCKSVVAGAGRAERDRIEASLAALLGPPDAGVRGAMHYAVFGPAGRARPLLALRTARAAGTGGAQVLRAACAIELVHSASLVVDDLPCMDGALARRGRPSVHVKFGESAAILAAHSLVALAARSLIGAGGPLADMVRFQDKLLTALDPGELTGGQEMDLRRTGTRAEINERKTVPLFRLAVEAGMLGARLSEDRVRALRGFAREFGMAFQLADDFLDGELAGIAEVRQHADRAIDSLAPLGAAADGLREMTHELLAKTER